MASVGEGAVAYPNLWCDGTNTDRNGRERPRQGKVVWKKER